MNIFGFAIYAIFVTFVSLRPMDSTSLEGWDKVGHLVLYFIFALIAYRVASIRRHYIYLCVGIVVYSGLMEIAQSYMPGRMMSGYDLLANVIGVAIAMLITSIFFNTRADK